MILILAGAGAHFGTGHVERMRILKGLLESRGHSVSIRLTDEPEAERGKHGDSLIIFDARDSACDVGERVIAVDNRSSIRSGNTNVVFHDTLPHPEVSMDLALNQCLIDPALLTLERRTEDKASILVYSGQEAPPELAVEGKVFQVGRDRMVGAAGANRLDRTAFLERLAASRVLVSYFGMTVLEAMFLGIPAVTYSIGSTVHDTLSALLEKETNVRFYRKSQKAGQEIFELTYTKRPSGQGFQILIDLIERYL